MLFKGNPLNSIASRTGHSIRTISNLLSVSQSTIHRWVNRKIQLCRKRKIKSLVCYEKIIGNYVRLNPDCRLKDIKESLVERYGKIVSLSTICRYLRLLGISYKKITIQNYTDWGKLIQQRVEFEKKIKSIPKDRVISLDESYFYKRMIRSYGYSNIGEKCIVKNRAGMKKYSLLLVISIKKILAYEFQLANFNSYSFYLFLQTKLLPIIKNKIIIMDNASFHKCKEGINLIRTHGCEVMFIPPYSPQYNPIEIVFRMLKSIVC